MYKFVASDYSLRKFKYLQESRFRTVIVRFCCRDFAICAGWFSSLLAQKTRDLSLRSLTMKRPKLGVSSAFNKGAKKPAAARSSMKAAKQLASAASSSKAAKKPAGSKDLVPKPSSRDANGYLQHEFLNEVRDEWVDMRDFNQSFQVYDKKKKQHPDDF